MEQLDFTHSRRKGWNLLRKLGAAQRPPATKHFPVSANQVASHLVNVAKAPLSKPVKRQVHDEWRQYNRSRSNSNEFVHFSISELDGVLESIKLGTAAGYDYIFPEFLKFLGPRARGWLCAFLGRVVSEKSVPKVWRQAKVVAPLKPGKDPKAVASYRPISLLSVPMKLLERLLLLRISPVLESVLSPDQAGFRKKRSTCDQVLAITTFIENGFQRGLKTGAIFLDLTAAYDTVWHTGLLVKLSRVLPRWFVETVELLISNRRFRVHLGDKVSSWRRQKNGLPQGSVLSPSLFNVYINDLPPTHSRKFIYADDICLGTQASNLVLLQERLQDDLSVMAEYCRTWRLIPSANKTVSSLFHLHHAASHSQLQLSIQGKSLQHDPLPVYLGVSLDRTLTYKDHIIKTAKKLKSRNNLISKLAGTNWGARTNTLRTSALALCYSVAEYCAPVWARSAHVHRLDVQLNHTMRLISGTLRPTEIPWLPVLSNIAPPDIRRWAASAKLLSNIQSHDNLPLLQDIYDPPPDACFQEILSGPTSPIHVSQYPVSGRRLGSHPRLTTNTLFWIPQLRFLASTCPGRCG